VAPQPSQSGTVWTGAVTATTRPWPHQPHRAFLFISGAHGPDTRLPDAVILNQWLDQLRSWGYTSVRTSALAPAASDSLRDVGFSTCQNLVLLSRVGATTSSSIAPDLTPHRIRLRPHLPLVGKGSDESIDRILTLDEASFGREWCLDRASLLDAYKATQRAALLEVRSADKRSSLGFILVGRTGTAGFIQRLAVHPSVRRTGLASILLAAGTQWLHSHGARIMAVNTEDTNTAALGLYERHGFQPMPYGLFVLERELV